MVSLRTTPARHPDLLACGRWIRISHSGRTLWLKVSASLVGQVPGAFRSERGKYYDICFFLIFKIVDPF